MYRISEIPSDTDGYITTVWTVNIKRRTFITSSLMPIVIEIDNALCVASQRGNDFIAIFWHK
jgi:hypothetical protein